MGQAMLTEEGDARSRSALTFLLPCEEKLCEFLWRLPPLRSSCGFQTSPLSLARPLEEGRAGLSRMPLCTMSSVQVSRRLHRYSSVSLSTTSSRVSVSTALMRCTTWRGQERLSTSPGDTQGGRSCAQGLSAPPQCWSGKGLCFQLVLVGQKGKSKALGDP